MKDQEKAQSLILKLMPSKKIHFAYIQKSKEFIAYFEGFKGISVKKSHVYKLEYVTSKYFKRKYLVAFVDRNWFKKIAPACDAAASSQFFFLGIQAPPLLLIPSKTFPKRVSFKSVVEHEIVHINQALNFELPDLRSCLFKHEILFRELIKHIRSEYEANFIQLAFDSTLIPPDHYKISLEEWCHLRGFTDGIECILRRLFLKGEDKAEFKKFVQKIRKELPQHFRKNQLDVAIGKRYAHEIEKYLAIAFQNVITAAVSR